MIDIEIEIREKLNGNPIGQFKISNSKWSSSNNKENFNIVSEDYDIIAKIEKSLIIHSPDEIDNKTPIQFLINPEWNLSQVLLLEEQEYTVEYKSEVDTDEENIFFSFKKYNSTSFKNIYNDFSSKKYVASLYFASYAGKVDLDIFSNGKLIDIPIEIRSKKMNYYDDFYKIIEDFNDFIGLTFDKNAPTNLNFSSAPQQTTLFEKYLFLKFLFKSEHLPYTVEYLSQNLYSRLEDYPETVPTPFASNIGANELMDIASNSANFFEVKNKFRNSIRKNDKNYLPIEIIEKNFKDNIDIPENRFYKNFLELIYARIEELLIEIKKSDDEIQNKNRHFDITKDSYVKKNLNDYKNQTINFLSKDYFQEISKMDYPPLNSQTLQKREGYRDILKYFLMLDIGFQINWLNSDTEGSQKKLSRLYEYWCYFKLIDILEEITNDEKGLGNILEISEDNWSISLDVDKRSHLYFDYDGCCIELMYNQEFTQTLKSDFYSYSQIYKPDYTLAIHINKKCYFLHFDAKYKVSEGEGPKKEDIDKMHTYKDAIKHTKCAYVLYPGKNKETEHPEKTKMITYLEEKESLLNSVGACPLKPGNLQADKECLKNFIENVINEIIEEQNASLIYKLIDIKT